MTILFSPATALFDMAINSMQEFQFPYILPTLVIFWFFESSHPNGHKVAEGLIILDPVGKPAHAGRELLEVRGGVVSVIENNEALTSLQNKAEGKLPRAG